MSITIKNPIEDGNGNKKENIFIAFDEAGNYLGHSYVYPNFNEDITPLNPYSLYMDVEGTEIEVKNQLYRSAFERAKELRALHPNIPARIYGGCLIDQKEKLAFYESFGLIPDDGTYVYELLIDKCPEIDSAIVGMAHRFEDETLKQMYIETHNRIFVRKIDASTLDEFSQNPMYMNFGIISDHKLMANIMLYEKQGIGYIENLFVLNSERKHGMGKILLTQAIRYFYQQGLSKIQLEVWGRNAYAVELYKKFGFKWIGATELYPGLNV